VVYGGKTVNLLGKTSDVVRDLIDKGLHKAILLPSVKTGKDLHQDIPRRFVVCLKRLMHSHELRSSITLSAFLETGDDRELTFAQLPFDHPAFILYSSGTTGKPKCIVHSAGVCKLLAFILRYMLLTLTFREC
jgi:acetoacetyl-CoA synthetase